jgi:hypothetical protein
MFLNKLVVSIGFYTIKSISFLKEKLFRLILIIMKKLYAYSLIFLTYVTIGSNQLFANTCTSNGSGYWDNSSSWNCDAGTSNPPEDSWANGVYIFIRENDEITIHNNQIIDLTDSNTKELRIAGTLRFGSNAKIKLPKGATIVLDNEGIIVANNNSQGTLVEIGGKGIWGRECENKGCSNEELNGPGHLNESSDPNKPLPVTLISFQGISRLNEIELTWSTAMEKGFSHFVIQRSSNGTNFTDIGIVKGRGHDTTEKSNYSFTDTSPIASILYYRLKAIDVDGSYEIFKPISVTFNGSPLGLTVSPNPIRQGKYFSLKLPLDSKGNAQLTLTDVKGKIVFSTHTNLENAYILQPVVKPGLYILTYQNESQVLQSKILIE